MAATAHRDRAPRRLTREARREQLVAAALPVLAEQGFADFSLDEVAARAGVTRNLIYHYFARGRPDIVVAVVELAEHQLTDDWLFDEAIPLPERVAANFARILDHALAPTDAWRVHRRSQSSVDPELRPIADRFVDVAIRAISTNQLGTPDPPPLARLVLRGYLSFAETLLDDTSGSGASREQVTRVLTDTLRATLDAAAAASA
jgi:AcrR family transcriptional regulator